MSTPLPYPRPSTSKAIDVTPWEPRGVDANPWEPLRWRSVWGRECWDNLDRRYWRKRKSRKGNTTKATLGFYSQPPKNHN